MSQIQKRGDSKSKKYRTFRVYCFYLFTLIVIGCSDGEPYEIISVWNMQLSIPENNNQSTCENCDKSSVVCCEFEYNGVLYKRRESYILDETGNIDSVYSYAVPLGVNIISLEDQLRLAAIDTLYCLNLKDRKIYWDASREVIVDGNFVYDNFEVDSDNNYLKVETASTLKLYKFK